MITGKQLEEAVILQSLCEKAGTAQGLTEIERQVLVKCANNLAKLIKQIYSDLSGV